MHTTSPLTSNLAPATSHFPKHFSPSLDRICDHRRRRSSSSSSSLLQMASPEKSEMAALLTTKTSSSTMSQQQHTPFEADELQQTTSEVVNRDPSFGSFLLNDDFGQRATDNDDDDDLKGLDPLKLEGMEKQRDERTRIESDGKGEPASRLEPLLRNPNGATQLFTDMHGVSSGIEDLPGEDGHATTGMRHLVGLAEDTPQLGVTDWGSGTDGGRSGKVQKGVSYGSFLGM